MSNGVMILVAVAAIVIVVAVVAAAFARRRRPSDHVDSFRRQIDALSPESRRPTIDQMKPSPPPPSDDDGDNAP